ncbi:hypothetical protein [[Mycoplasma] mobile]|uniref:Putative expressed lipoprotein n=1 Tax=Mycoplasma mobile (strain ATCC 43663 / 163K / NCTC 11711) TaxID=267748 RepID=Q6KHM1_MYCM1|nr:hypothetical protein [[Mycoplasma] mobile]AAT27909.1 putative expressed lipoprotein [Mycoplasma mobile 163K]
MIINKKLKYGLIGIIGSISVSTISFAVISCGTTTSIPNTFSIKSFAHLYGPIQSIQTNFVEINQNTGTSDISYALKTLKFDSTTIASATKGSDVINEFKLEPSTISTANSLSKSFLKLKENFIAKPGNYFIEVEIKRGTNLIGTQTLNFNISKLPVSIEKDPDPKILAAIKAPLLLNTLNLLNVSNPFSFVEIKLNNALLMNSDFIIEKDLNSNIYYIKKISGEITSGNYSISVNVEFTISGKIATEPIEVIIP